MTYETIAKNFKQMTSAFANH